MKSTFVNSLTSLVLMASTATADFGVWHIQESDAFGNNAIYPLVTDGSVQSGKDVYNWWSKVAHWYDLECDGCNHGDGYDHAGGKLQIGESWNGDGGKKLTFEGTQEGEGKDACGQLFGISCDYVVTDETGAQIGGCEFGGHALSFVENLMGVVNHLDGFRSLWCVSQQFTPTTG
ncbi:hypothetical protein FALBO_12463 [Fusarium albosuccineum]|uniref:Uncharacterized protein n=1 Tax=Fusarium albosuccineum TaxID=1237068 RepID=A0A8H4L3Z5_9HYPO|nr:hypothetical protein FALBO_12463 [Fusarium albosuccineum]